MGGSGLQWSFSGKASNPPQILSFKPASEGISHSIYPPGFVQNAQKAGSADKNASVSLANRHTHSYGAFINRSREALKVSVASGHTKTGQLVASPLNSPSPVRSNGSRVHPESLGSAYKVPCSSVSPVNSAVVGSTNLRSGEGSYNGPSQMTIFYDGLVCVYDDVAPEKAQAIMLLAGNGNSRSRKPAEPVAKAQPNAAPSPPVAMEVNVMNPSSVLPKPITPAPVTDLSDSSSSKVSETSSGLSKAGVCTSKVEISLRNLGSNFPTSRAGSPASNHIRLSQSAIPVDPVSAGASPSTVEVNPRIPAMRYSSPTPGSTGTHRFRFCQSAIRIDPVLAGASVSKVESPKHPATSGSNQIRFSQSCFDPSKPVSAAISTDSVSARPSTSRLETSSNNPAPSNQIRFSQSAGASSIAAVEANPKNSASNFPLPATGSTGPNQIHFSRSAIPIDSGSAGTTISIVESNPIKPKTPNSGSHQFRFPQSATPLDHASCGASNSIVESSPIISTAKFPDPATSSGSHKSRFSQSSMALPSPYLDRSMPGSSTSDIKKPNSAATRPTDTDRASPRPTSNAESSAAKPASKFPTPAKGPSEPNQFRFSQSGTALSYLDRSMPGSLNSEIKKPNSAATPTDRASPGPPSGTEESSAAKPASKFPTPAKGPSEPTQFRFSKSGTALSYLDRSMPGSSNSDIKKPNSAATPTDRASPSPSTSTVESSAAKPASKFPAPAKGTGEPNQFRFSQSGTANSAMPLSYLDRSTPGSSTTDLKKPNSATTPTDRTSPGPSSSPVESSAAKPASKFSAPAKGSGEPNQLRFSQSGVPLARKASLARFLEKRKERPSGDLGDLPPCKFRSNSG